jgi:uncharacterized protein YlxW (UPF0749 family)
MLGENYLNNSYRAHRTNWAFLLTVVFGVVVAGVFIYYYIQTTNIISQRNLTITTQQVESVSLNSQITSLENGLTTASSTIASLQGQLSSTQSQLTSANAQILSLGNDLSAGKSQIANLQSQVSSYQNQVFSYQTQIATLQSQQSQNNELQNIVNLAAYAAEASSVPVSQAAGQMSQVTSFTANYAGYIVVSGSSSSGSGYVRVTDTYSSYPYNSYNYPFSTSGSVFVPVLPGTITVYYGNNDAAAVTATISVMYYY